MSARWSLRNPASNRADHNQPMFNSSRPSHKGGGSFHAGLLVLLLVLLGLKLGRITRGQVDNNERDQRNADQRGN